MHVLMANKELAYLLTLSFMHVYMLWMTSGRTVILIDAMDVTLPHFSCCSAGVALVSRLSPWWRFMASCMN